MEKPRLDYYENGVMSSKEENNSCNYMAKAIKCWTKYINVMRKKA